MRKILKNNSSLVVISVITSCIFILIQCINNDNETKSNNTTAPDTGSINYQQFAGAATCANCHKDVYEKHLHSAHYLTSQPAFEKYIKGSFDPSQN
ncbi:MAG: hypothetical protein M3015_15060, partial [Bacteroidota bacterium]|nr:hypothetical protein [Bacteroidota bacterium]